jgi:hypothetical protein
VVLVVTLVFALPNLQSIYSAQKDFTVGSLLSLTGFCLGRALSRTEEQRSIEHIRTSPSKDIAAALREQQLKRLHTDGVFQRLALLSRNLEAAAERIAEYYDTEARRLDFYRYLPLLRVVLSDIDQARSNIVGIERALGVEGVVHWASGPQGDRGGYTVPTAARLALASLQRDLREALGRRDQTYEWLVAHHGRAATDELWDVFATMTSDTLKADRLMDILLAQYVAFPPREVLSTTLGYLAAAINRADEATAIFATLGFPGPKIFEVMKQDMAKARDALERVDVTPQPAPPPAVQPAPTAAAQPMP